MLGLSLAENVSAVILVMADMERRMTTNVTYPVLATPALNVAASRGCRYTRLLIVSLSLSYAFQFNSKGP